MRLVGQGGEVSWTLVSGESREGVLGLKLSDQCPQGITSSQPMSGPDSAFQERVNRCAPAMSQDMMGTKVGWVTWGPNFELHEETSQHFLQSFF